MALPQICPRTNELPYGGSIRLLSRSCRLLIPYLGRRASVMPDEIPWIGPGLNTLKLLYLALKNVGKRCQATRDWKPSLNHFTLLWGDRIEAAWQRPAR